MKKYIWLSAAMLIGLFAACGAPPTPTTVPKPDPTPVTLVLGGGYRPVQTGDQIEGAVHHRQHPQPEQVDFEEAQ